MKLSVFASLFALLFCSCAEKEENLSSKGSLIADYCIVYSSSEPSEEGSALALKLRNGIQEACGVKLEVKSRSAGDAAPEILVGRSGLKESDSFYGSEYDEFEYRIFASGNKIVVGGGCSWALSKAAEVFGSLVSDGNVPSGLDEKGTAYGEKALEYEYGANLRIFDWNVWNYAGSTNPAEWEALGYNCLNSVRSRGLSGVIFACMPDVVALQEYSKLMDASLGPLLAGKAYVQACTADGWNWTPIFYDSNRLELLESSYTLHGPTGFNDSNSKSFTVAVFKHKASGKKFIAVNTHLWWKSESAQAGSNDARSSQVRAIIESVGNYVQKYDCPVAVMGDMNCNLLSDALKQFTANGYSPAWEVAKIYGDKSHGWHPCDKTGFSADYPASAKTDGTSCIDHMMVHNLGGSSVQSFRRETVYFTVYLSDHYPNYMDMAL